MGTDILPKGAQTPVVADDSTRSVVEQLTQYVGDLVSSGALKGVSVQASDNGSMSFSATSSDGQSKIYVEKKTIGTYQETTTTTYQKPDTIDKRREIVGALRAGGLTQQQIADRIPASQQTVSRDLKILDTKTKPEKK